MMSSSHFDGQDTTLSTIPRLISQVLKIYEVLPEDVFRKAGISIDEMVEKDERIPMDQMHRLWDAAVELTENKALGLICASLFQPAYIKGLGLAWMASKNLIEGLKLFIKNGALVNTAVNIELQETDDEMLIRYSPSQQKMGKIKAHPCALQLGIGFFLKMFRLAAGKPIPPTAVYFTIETPEDIDAYSEFFQCPIHFSQEYNGISFSKQLLVELLPTRDDELVEMNKLAVEKYVNALKRPELIEKVSSMVTGLLPAGCPTEEEVAFRLHMSKRTLQRKLKAEGEAFSHLLNSIRFDLAKEYLTATNNSVTEIAYSLGYSSPSTFARAFKHTSGNSPAEFRKDHEGLAH